ncbi:MAG: phage head closure protein [Clostridiales bacterium]|nr:phage head closure protein [Clostridiales bacterium]
MNLAEKIALITIEYTQDDLGEWVEEQTKTEVFALISSVSMSEFYQAGLQGFKPDFRFAVWMKEYNNEEIVEYNGKIFNVYRTYIRDDGRIELYVNEKKGDESEDDT